MKKRKKQALTLIEIMVVIALIGIIGSVVGVNMKKSLDQGKDFKTKMHIQKIEDAINLYYAQNDTDIDSIETNAEKILKKSGLFKDESSILKDAWGNTLVVKFDDGEFTCRKQPKQPKQ